MAAVCPDMLASRFGCRPDQVEGVLPLWSMKLAQLVYACVWVSDDQVGGSAEVFRVQGKHYLSILVAPEKHTQGIGTRLVEEAITQAKRLGIDTVYMVVHRDGMGQRLVESLRTDPSWVIEEISQPWDEPSLVYSCECTS
jgi:GNAT superfamily N-acetyltransferase